MHLAGEREESEKVWHKHTYKATELFLEIRFCLCNQGAKAYLRLQKKPNLFWILTQKKKKKSQKNKNLQWNRIKKWHKQEVWRTAVECKKWLTSEPFKCLSQHSGSVWGSLSLVINRNISTLALPLHTQPLPCNTSLALWDSCVEDERVFLQGRHTAGHQGTFQGPSITHTLMLYPFSSSHF